MGLDEIIENANMTICRNMSTIPSIPFSAHIIHICYQSCGELTNEWSVQLAYC